MPRYAPGTDIRDEQIERRQRHTAQRRNNISDTLLGLGMIAQQMGAVRRQRDAEASQQLHAQRLSELMSGGGGQGGPQVVGDPYSQPSMALPPTDGRQDGYDVSAVPGGHLAQAPSFEQRVVADARTPSGFFENLGRTFGIGSGKAGLTPQQQTELIGLSRQMRGEEKADRRYEEDQRYKRGRDSAEDAYREEMLRLRGREIESEDQYRQGSLAAKSAGGDGGADDRRAAISALGNEIEAADRRIQGYNDRATRLDNYTVSTDDVALRNIIANENTPEEDRETLRRIIKGSTDPIKRAEALAKKAQELRDEAGVISKDPAYISMKESYRRAAPRFASEVEGMFGVRAQTGDPAAEIAAIAEQMFPGVTDPTPEQIEAVRRAYESGGR